MHTFPFSNENIRHFLIWDHRHTICLHLTEFCFFQEYKFQTSTAAVLPHPPRHQGGVGGDSLRMQHSIQSPTIKNYFAFIFNEIASNKQCKQSEKQVQMWQNRQVTTSINAVCWEGKQWDLRWVGLQKTSALEGWGG